MNQVDEIDDLKEDMMDKKRLAYPRLKLVFDVIGIIGVVMLVVKLGLLLLRRFTELDFVPEGGSLYLNIGSLLLMVVGGIGSGVLKEKYVRE
ncbi:hypothetical protein ACFO9Q_15890 [Paenibacillus sp. GCM10023252]|uniref:hypothetical protein n=1 Tax=Paenibacillus sp. GCM10023252 TaxID=3252649 RepID=UPI003607D8A0